jgi:hypothetical protein
MSTLSRIYRRAIITIDWGERVFTRQPSPTAHARHIFLNPSQSVLELSGHIIADCLTRYGVVRPAPYRIYHRFIWENYNTGQLTELKAGLEAHGPAANILIRMLGLSK